MPFNNLNFDKPRPKEQYTTLPSLAIEASNGETAKAMIYRLEDGTFQSVINANNREAIGVSAESPEIATENALNELGNISAENEPIWTLKYHYNREP